MDRKEQKEGNDSEASEGMRRTGLFFFFCLFFFSAFTVGTFHCSALRLFPCLLEELGGLVVETLWTGSKTKKMAQIVGEQCKNQFSESSGNQQMNRFSPKHAQN